MGDMLDCTAIATAAARTDPYRHFAYSGAFTSDRTAAELLATFPDEGYEWQIEYKIDQALRVDERKAARHKKRMRVAVDIEHTELIDPGSLSAAWRAVMAEVLSPAYREAVSTATQVDVRRMGMLAHFWRFAPGSYFRPHVDLPHKAVTHLFYFGAGWRSEWGGCLRLLDGPDMAAAAVEYAPVLNTAVIQVRSDDAWHAVSTLAPDCPHERLVFQVWFHR